MSKIWFALFSLSQISSKAQAAHTCHGIFNLLDLDETVRAHTFQAIFKLDVF